MKGQPYGDSGLHLDGHGVPTYYGPDGPPAEDPQACPALPAAVTRLEGALERMGAKLDAILEILKPKP
jgi:hypothetical protein